MPDCIFADPNVLVDEMGDNSVLITEHRYSQRYNQALKRGIYCVQFITFKNTADGLLALNWWSGKCLEWCYSRLEDGKFGDQKYLDDWPVRFKGVHVLKHLGGGVAPWNIQRYTLYNHKNRVSVYEGNDSADLIFYHFHYVKFYKNDQMDLGNYKFSKEVKTILYQRYISHISQIEATLLNEFQFGRVVQGYFYKSKLLIPLHRLARIILGIYNIEIVADFKDGKFN